jgi:uncharacterized protein
MSTVIEHLVPAYRAGEHHSFSAAGVDFWYLVPSGSIFALEGIGREILTLLEEEALDQPAIVQRLMERGYSYAAVADAIDELVDLEAIAPPDGRKPMPPVPLQEFPLQRVVLNITNQCNLACTYCYEYSDDRIAQTAGKQKYMHAEIAEASVEMLLQESGSRPSIHVTFFGGETLLNFPVMRSTVIYARRVRRLSSALPPTRRC